MPKSMQQTASIAREIAAGHGIGTSTVAREFSTSHSTILRWVTRGLPAGGTTRLKL